MNVGWLRARMPDGAKVLEVELPGAGRRSKARRLPLAVAWRKCEERSQYPVPWFAHDRGDGRYLFFRVLPMPPGEAVSVTVRYEQPLSDPAAVWTLPLQGVGTIANLSIRALATGKTDDAKSEPTQHALAQVTPKYDLKVRRTPEPAADERAALATPPDKETALDPIGTALVLVDTSAAREEDFASQLEALSALLASIANHGGGDVEVVAFDRTSAPIFTGPASEFGPSQVKKLRARGAGGTCNLSAALDGIARAGAKPDRRIIVLTDGVATGGARTSVGMKRALAELGSSNAARRIDTVTVGDGGGMTVLTLVTRALKSMGAMIRVSSENADFSALYPAQRADDGSVSKRSASTPVNPTTLIVPQTVKQLQRCGLGSMVSPADLPMQWPKHLPQYVGLPGEVDGRANLDERVLEHRRLVQERKKKSDQGRPVLAEFDPAVPWLADAER